MKFAGPESIAVKRRVCGLDSLVLSSCPEEVLKRLFAKKGQEMIYLISFAENYTQAFYLRIKSHIFVLHYLNRAWQILSSACGHLTQILYSLGKWAFFTKQAVNNTESQRSKCIKLDCYVEQTEKRDTSPFSIRSQILHCRSSTYAPSQSFAVKE